MCPNVLATFTQCSTKISGGNDLFMKLQSAQQVTTFGSV